jgi:hypothetical protein
MALDKTPNAGNPKPQRITRAKPAARRTKPPKGGGESLTSEPEVKWYRPGLFVIKADGTVRPRDGGGRPSLKKMPAGTPIKRMRSATKENIPNAEDAPDSLLNAAEEMWAHAVELVGDDDSEARRFFDKAIAQLEMALTAVKAGASARLTAAQISEIERRVRAASERLISATIISLEDTPPGSASLETPGISGAKDEGLVQEPQREIADAGVETARRQERQLSTAELGKFLVHAAANKWDSNSGVAPSAHIKTTFAKWLGRGLWREHIVKAQPNLASAYAAEVSRDPSKRVEGLAVRPHKLPAGSPRPLSVRLVAELSEAERELRREAERTKKKRWRERLAKQNL